MLEKTILVVDHSAPRRDHLRQLLGGKKIAVREASSCEEALAILASESIPLIISETDLPGKSGLFLLKKLKERDPDLEVILITHGDSYNILQALRCGAHDFIVRPIDSGEIVFTAVERAFQRIQARVRTTHRVSKLERDNLSLRHTVQRMKELMSTFERMMQASDTEALLKITLESAMTELDTRRGLVGIFDRASGYIGLKIGNGIPAAACRRYSSRIPDGLIVEIAVRGKPVLIPGVLPKKLQALASPDEMRDLLAAPGLLAAPLRLKGRAVGVILLSGSQGEDPLTPLDLQFLTKLSNIAALNLEKAGIIHQLKREKA